MIKQLSTVSLLLIAFLVLQGCSSTAVPRTGFISDYSKLVKVDSNTVRFISPNLGDYNSFIVDPVQIRTTKSTSLTRVQRAEAANYFHRKLVEVLRKNGYQVTQHAGVGTVRVRYALTEIQDATWWLNVMPTSKVTGAGVGGASMEGEVIDSITGEQLAAVVRTGKGNQFELDTFDALDDVKDVIDKWVKDAEKRLHEFREGR